MSKILAPLILTLVAIALVASALVVLPLAILGLFVLAGISIFLSALERRESPLTSHVGRARWNMVPGKSRIEALANRLQTPALISHKESTEIVFANVEMQKLLGFPLIGRTIEYDEELPFKIVEVNQEPASRDNHPVWTLRRDPNPMFSGLVTVLTPKGRLTAELRARKLFAVPEQVGDFLIYTALPKSLAAASAT